MILTGFSACINWNGRGERNCIGSDRIHHAQSCVGVGVIAHFIGDFLGAKPRSACDDIVFAVRPIPMVEFRRRANVRMHVDNHSVISPRNSLARRSFQSPMYAITSHCTSIPGGRSGS